MSGSSIAAGLGFALAAVGIALPLHAQQEAASVTWSARAEVAGEIERLRSESAGGPSRSFEERRIREKMRLGATGWLLRPEVLLFRLNGDFGLRNEALDLTGSSFERNRGRIFDYDGSFEFFPESTLSLTLSGTRFEDRDIQGFGADTEVRRDARVALLRLRARVLPSVLGWRRVSSVSETLGLIPNRRDEVREILSFDGNRRSPTTRLRLQYRDEDVSDRSFPPIGDYRLREVRGSLGRTWGAYLEHSARIAGGAFQRSGRFERETVSADGSYRWEVTEDLLTGLRYGFDRFETDAGDTELQRADWRLRHQLYQSLTSAVRLSGERTIQSNGKVSQYGGGLSFSYRKRFPWASRLLADLRVQRDIEDSDLDSALVPVVGEQVLIDGGTSNLLENPRAADVVVTTLAGDPLIEGIDYELVPVGLFTSIEPLPGGVLTPPQTVRVDYAFLTAPEARVLDARLGFGVGWDLGWLVARYRHSETNERLLSGGAEAAQFLLDRRFDRYSLLLRRQGTAVRAAAEFSFERERGTTLDRDEWTLTQRLAWSVTPALGFHVSLQEGRAELRDSSRTISLLSGTASVSWRLSRSHRARVFARFRDRNDSLDADQLDVLVGGRVELRFGRLSVLPVLGWELTDRELSRATQVRGALRLVWAL